MGANRGPRPAQNEGLVDMHGFWVGRVGDKSFLSVVKYRIETQRMIVILTHTL